MNGGDELHGVHEASIEGNIQLVVSGMYEHYDTYIKLATCCLLCQIRTIFEVT